jgi:hypothetical protein
MFKASGLFCPLALNLDLSVIGLDLGLLRERTLQLMS